MEVAENGQQVVEKVQQNSYDLILMDMQMPIMDGLIATMTLRNLGYQAIPIIGLTANAFKQDRDRCLDAGMNDYISKPVNSSKLIEMIRRWLCRDTIISSSSQDQICVNDVKDQYVVVEEALRSGENSLHAQFQGQVLVADDRPVNQILIQILLKKLGLKVAIVDNGKQAIEKMNYDLIFMDMQMPVMDGCEAVRFLRSRSVQTPIIALTANAMPEDRRKCIEAGFSDYLTKPIDYPQFVEIIEKYLKPISCGNTLPE